MTIDEFEKEVWRIDGVRIVIRAPRLDKVDDFNWVNAADESQSLTKYSNIRILPNIGDLPYSVVAGDGEEPNGKNSMKTLRKSYIRN